jgi:hypothetical protein
LFLVSPDLKRFTYNFFLPIHWSKGFKLLPKQPSFTLSSLSMIDLLDIQRKTKRCPEFLENWERRSFPTNMFLPWWPMKLERLIIIALKTFTSAYPTPIGNDHLGLAAHPRSTVYHLARNEAINVFISQLDEVVGLGALDRQGITSI